MKRGVSEMGKQKSREPEGSGQLVFRSQDRVGAIDAEEDGEFLKECFVDNGDLGRLKDVRLPDRIVLGRTGVGKTALLQRVVETSEHATWVKPEALALSYISNSTILKYFEGLGVKLDVFYKLLWRHVFCVEILSRKFPTEADGRVTIWDKLRSLVRSASERKAVEYLRNWGGEKFFEQTEERVKEVTRKLEKSLEGSIGGSAKHGDDASASAEVKSRKAMTEEQKSEVVQRAQAVINAAQVEELNGILELVNGVLVDDQRPHLIVIDRLDEDWVEEDLRYKLIMALIETVKDFRKVQNAKIIIALREDLIERVFRRARPVGFQAEKYATLYLRVTWSKERLRDMLSLRINVLLRDRYSARRTLTIDEVLPPGSKGGIDYMLERTFLRPRDLIQFFNECLTHTEGRTATISNSIVRRAEEAYSRKRLESVEDEWRVDYPSLELLVPSLLRGRSESFDFQSLLDQRFDDACLDIAVTDEPPKLDPLDKACRKCADSTSAREECLREILAILFRTGIVGVKLSTKQKVQWAQGREVSLRASEIGPETRIEVHKMFLRALDIDQRQAP